jgi:cob(I)alamin adenosyltransferase
LKRDARSVTRVDILNANMPIYTRTGDTGSTSLFGGKRVLKSETLVEVYGSVDELNSWVGVIVSQIPHEHLKKLFSEIQSDLFTVGGNLAGWKSDLSMLDTRASQMEVEIDVMEKELPALTNFILPGGSPLGAQTHVARSVCRRVERQIVALTKKQTVDPRIVKYLNRLSDLFFVLARFINKNANVEEIVWSGIPRQKPR